MLRTKTADFSIHREIQLYAFWGFYLNKKKHICTRKWCQQRIEAREGPLLVQCSPTVMEMYAFEEEPHQSVRRERGAFCSNSAFATFAPCWTNRCDSGPAYWSATCAAVP